MRIATMFMPERAVRLVQLTTSEQGGGARQSPVEGLTQGEAELGLHRFRRCDLVHTT